MTSGSCKYRIVIDLDLTLTSDCPASSYEDKPVNLDVVERLREYKRMGYSITIFTSRNMRTYKGNLDLIKQNTLPIIEEWLAKHEIPYDEIIVGKPWCGTHGFYVDDRSIRPDEFAKLSADEIQRLVNAGTS
jgi:capsule biosynthesis phosphatase